MIPNNEFTRSPDTKADEIFMQIETQLVAYWSGDRDGGNGYRMTLNRIMDRLKEHADTVGCPTGPSPLWVRTRTLNEMRALLGTALENEDVI